MYILPTHTALGSAIRLVRCMPCPHTLGSTTMTVALRIALLWIRFRAAGLLGQLPRTVRRFEIEFFTKSFIIGCVTAACLLPVGST